MNALVVAPTGFFWQSARKPAEHRQSVRIYGEFQLPARWNPDTQSAVDMTEGSDLSWTDYWQAYKSGTWPRMVGARSGVLALASRSGHHREDS